MISPINWHSLMIWGRRLTMDVILSAAALFAVTILPLLQVTGTRELAISSGILWHVVFYAGVSAVVFGLTKTYRMIWRYVSFWDFLKLMGAVTLIVGIFALSELVIARPSGPMPVTLVAWTLLLLWTAHVGFLAAPRFIVRFCFEGAVRKNYASSAVREAPQDILLTGDPVRIEAFIRECEHDLVSRYCVLGVLSENKQFHGSYMHGVQVMDSVENLERVLAELALRGLRPGTLVMAKDNPSGNELARLLELTTGVNVKLGRLPPSGLLSGGTSVLPINLSDLLQRPEVRIDMQAVAWMIEGRCVLVTGAGGSIGSELTRQVAGFKPSKLVVLDNCEFNLYSIDKELEEKFPGVVRETALVDVRDGTLISKWIEASRPDVVFHAAALKHVPMLEDHPVEGIKTNVFGTINVAEACRTYGVRTMVTISTDKAVNPTNVMGATKRLAEAYCQGLDQASDNGSSTRFVTVRFGNVLGSAGSVVPLFQHQIEMGGPVTVTHPEIKRYFMTIPEAVTLVLQAGARGEKAAEERGHVYVLDMGEPVKIIDLAHQMVRLAGARPGIDIKIKITGLRPGEKLYEEVIHTEEEIVPTDSTSILKLVPRTTDLRIIRQQIQELKQACTNGDRGRAVRLLKISVPCYQPSTPQKILAAAGDTSERFRDAPQAE